MDDQAPDSTDAEDRARSDDGDQNRGGASTEQAEVTETPSETASGAGPQDRDDDDEGEDDEDEDRRGTAEEFAREHDPAGHDISAGAEFRREGDWTAEETGDPRVWDAEGNLVEGSTSGRPDDGQRQLDGAHEHGPAESRRTSTVEEVRDGGYGVGSAAIIEDGAIPFGHPFKAWEDTKTFVAPDHPSYGDADPHLWFTGADAAQNAGFSQIA